MYAENRCRRRTVHHGHNLIISSNSIQFPAARRFFFHLQRIPRFRPTIWWWQISQALSFSFGFFSNFSSFDNILVLSKLNEAKEVHACILGGHAFPTYFPNVLFQYKGQ